MQWDGVDRIVKGKRNKNLNSIQFNTFIKEMGLRFSVSLSCWDV